MCHRAAEGLTKAFGGTPAGTGSDRFGRLAGFTFHEAEARAYEKRRFVLAHSGLGAEATNGSKYVQEVEKALRGQTTDRGMVGAKERSRGKTAGRKP